MCKIKNKVLEMYESENIKLDAKLMKKPIHT